jgi:hypothetical protein
VRASICAAELMYSFAYAVNNQSMQHRAPIVFG